MSRIDLKPRLAVAVVGQSEKELILKGESEPRGRREWLAERPAGSSEPEN